MTRSGLLMLIVTWGVVTFFMARFFLKVIRTPPREDE